jgi:hypothetical protein
MIDQIAKVNPAGVMVVESISERSLVLIPLSGRVVDKVLSTSMMIVEKSRARRRNMVKSIRNKYHYLFIYSLISIARDFLVKKVK